MANSAEIQFKSGVSAILLTEEDVRKLSFSTVTESTDLNVDINLLHNYNPQRGLVCTVERPTQIVKNIAAETKVTESTPALNFVYEIVSPEELNLKPVLCGLKRGRPKKQKVIDPPVIFEPLQTTKPAQRTRSGRVIKFPKHIEKDFKKIELSDESSHSQKHDEELKISDFAKFTEEPKPAGKVEQLEFHQRRRKISAQYRCPKCNKAYLGKNKMIEHIKKNPSHGPIPEGCNDLNFKVWNYLVDITQKCPPSQRGAKFCEELTNLLHNLLLLTSALFKKNDDIINDVKIDKVLGNAIGLPAGSYQFDHNKLYKDVTVLKLITNNEFFKPTKVSGSEAIVKNNSKENETNCKCDKHGVKEEKTKELSTLSENSENKANKLRHIEKPVHNYNEKNSSSSDAQFYFTENVNKHTDNINNQLHNDVTSQKVPYKAVESIPCYEKPVEKNKQQNLKDRLSLPSDLLSDNLLLNSLPNLRNTVDELILSGVESGNNILDNSSSSDEVMNVDQFVNERFKKITEPEMELNGLPLNLEYPSLDLFQFHSS